MKRSFFKSAAAFAVAVLMVIGASSSSFAVKADNNYLYYTFRPENGLPGNFDENPIYPDYVCKIPVNQYKVEPGKYYVQKLSDANVDGCYYRLILIKDVYEEPNEFNFYKWHFQVGSVRWAEILDLTDNYYSHIALSKTVLYEISVNPLPESSD
ncbi:MAG: hypothetical protein HUJ54_07640 [Erysipelotrichaceae bacterium]|nr:hypothetical protein [Erysipelotrichaceae bacterium]